MVAIKKSEEPLSAPIKRSCKKAGWKNMRPAHIEGVCLSCGGNEKITLAPKDATSDCWDAFDEIHQNMVSDDTCDCTWLFIITPKDKKAQRVAVLCYMDSGSSHIGRVRSECGDNDELFSLYRHLYSPKAVVLIS